MSATASRIALGVPAHPIAVPKPAQVNSGAGRGTPRRDQGGRFAPRVVWPTCTECGSILAENLLGNLRCLRQCCEQYRVVVDVMPGVQLGTLAAADIEPGE